MIGLLAAVLLQAKVDLPQALSSKHYEMKTSASKEEAQELLDFMELVHQTYTALLKPDNPQDLDKKRFTILLYKDMEEYVKAGAPPGSGAYVRRTLPVCAAVVQETEHNIRIAINEILRFMASRECLLHCH